jgi:hypothetical protein
MRASSYGKVRFADWCDRYAEYPSLKAHIPESCHTQAISVSRREIAVSCQGTGREQRGRLQSFDRAVLDAPAGLTTLHPGGVGNHPAIGNGVTLRKIDSRGRSGTAMDVFPVVNGGTGSHTADPTLVEVRRTGTHQRICGFKHTYHDGYGRRSLGAASLVAVNGQAYLAACGWNCDDFYLYHLADPSHPSCAPRLMSRLRARGQRSDTARVVDAGAGDRNWGFYNGVALLTNRNDELFMVGTHTTFLDTWQIQNYTSASPRYRKLAKFRWEGTWRVDGKPYFKQGLSTEFLSARRFAIWLSPHDYRSCGSAKCLRVYRCERGLD